jgi:hypothetical protein
VGGQHDDGNGRHVPALPEFARHVDAVAARHGVIQHDHVGTVRARHFQGALPVSGDAHAVSVVLQVDAVEGPQLQLVVGE